MMKQNNTIEEFTLSNGLTIWLSQDSSEPKVYGGMVVKAGAKDSPNSGIAHYFEHIMFKGTDTIGTIDYTQEAPILEKIAEKYSELKATNDPATHERIQKDINELSIEGAKYAIPNDFNNLINMYGGTGLNAGTSYDYTLFFNTFTPQYLEHWCWLNSERMIKPIFRLFQSELETVYEEKNMYDDHFATEPTQRVMQKVMAPHPYQYPIIGSTENLKTPDLHEMQTFFEKMYVAGNMALILTGDFKKEGLIELLEKTFGRIKSGTTPHHSYPTPLPFKGHERMEIKVPIPMIKASGRIWRTVPNSHTDQIALGIIQDLLSNESKTGRLDKLILNNKVVEASAMNVALNDAGIFGFIVIAKPLGGNSKGQKLVMREIERIIQGDISEEELKRAKLSQKRSYTLQFEDLEKRQKMLSLLFAQGRTWQEQLNDWEVLEQLTKEEVSAIARKYLSDNFLEIRKKSGRYPKNKLSKPPYAPIVAPNSHAQSPFALKLHQLPVPPLTLRTLDFKKDIEYTALNTTGKAKLYRTENSANDLFTLDLLYFRSRYQHPLSKELSQYLELVGCNAYPENEYNAKLQALGASINFEDTDNFFLIRIKGFDQYFSETLNLLQAFLFAPLVEPKKMSKLIQTKEISDKGLRKDPNAISKRLLEQVMHGKEASFHKYISLSKLKKLRPEVLLEEFSQILASELDAHYTGKLSISEVAPLLSQAIHSEEITLPWGDYLHLEAKERTTPEIHFLHDSTATQAIVRAYLPMGVLHSSELGLLRLYNQYCGGGMGSLLFQEIREYRSLAYGVSSVLDHPPFHQTNNLRSHLTFYLATQADKLIEAITLLDNLVHQAPDDGHRYQSAVEAIRSSIYNYYPFFRMRSRTIASFLRQGLEKDLPLLLLDDLEQATPQKLIEAHEHRIAHQPLIYTIVADRSKVDFKALSNIAPLHEYSLKDLEL